MARFTRQDVNLFIALNEYEDDIGPHGHPRSETMSPLASGSQRQWHYEAEGPFADNAAQAIAVERDAYRKAYPDKSLEGLFWRAKKVDG